MKKTFSVLLILMIFVGCCFGNAMADVFSVHSNVQFGMSMDEVKKLESDAGFEVNESTDLFRDCPTLEVTGNIAGVSGAAITYLFDNNKKLKEADYRMFAIGGIGGDYDTLLSALINKYGTPNADETWIAALNNPDILMTGRMIAYISNAMFGSVVSSKGEAWLQEQEDGTFVSIDIFNIINSDGKKLNYITYGSYTSEEIENLKNMVINGAQEYVNQINNDL